MNDCIFCKIVRGEIPSKKIRETADAYSFLDIKPVGHGHTLVIPKNHYENIFDVPEDVLAKVIIETKLIATAIQKVTRADGISISQNNGKAAGQIVNHIHFHIIPRYIKDNPISDSSLAEKITRAL